VKVKIVILPILLACASGVFAKQDKGMDDWMERRMKRLEQRLELTQEQKPKVEAILQEQREKFRAIHRQTQKRLKEVLTAEQWERLQAIHRKRMEHWRRSAKQPPE